MPLRRTIALAPFAGLVPRNRPDDTSLSLLTHALMDVESSGLLTRADDTDMPRGLQAVLGRAAPAGHCSTSSAHYSRACDQAFPKHSGGAPTVSPCA